MRLAPAAIAHYAISPQPTVQTRGGFSENPRDHVEQLVSAKRLFQECHTFPSMEVSADRTDSGAQDDWDFRAVGFDPAGQSQAANASRHKHVGKDKLNPVR